MPSIEQSTQFLRTRQFGLLVALGVVCLLFTLPQTVMRIGMVGVVGAGGLAAVLLATMLHPLVFFGFYFGALFFAETPIPGVPGVTANQLLAVLFLVSFGSYWLRGNAMRLTSGLVVPLAVVAAYFAVNAITGESFERGIVHFRYVVIYFLLAMCVAASLGSERAILAFAAVIVLLTFAAAVGGLVEATQKNVLASFTGRWGTAMRIRGTASNSIVYAWGLLFGFPFSFLLFAQLKSEVLRLLSLAAGLFILMIAALTFNRQTIAAIGLILVSAALLYGYRNRALLLGLLGVMGGVAAATLLPMLILRMSTLRTVSTDPSYLERRDSFLVGMEMFKSDPLFGVGLGSFPAVWREYLPPDFSTHYAQYMSHSQLKFPDFGFLALISESGIVGLGLFVALYALILRRTWRMHVLARVRGDRFARNLAATVLTLVLFILATSFIQDTFLYVRVWVMYALALLMDERLLFPSPQPSESDAAAA